MSSLTTRQRSKRNHETENDHDAETNRCRTPEPESNMIINPELPKLNFENRDESPWYLHSNFQRYWTHHSKVWKWYQQHLMIKYNQHDHITSAKLTPPETYWKYMERCHKYYQQWSTWWEFVNRNHFHESHCSLPQKLSVDRHVSTLADSTGRSTSGRNKRRANMSKSRKRTLRKRRSRKRMEKRARVEVSVTASGTRDTATFEVEMSEGGMAAEGHTQSPQYELEISDDMLDFFAQSAKHRQERGEIV